MSRESIDQFIQAVMRNQKLQEQLEAAPDQDSIVKLSVQLGEENGYSFTIDELKTMLKESPSQPELEYPLENMIPDGYAY